MEQLPALPDLQSYLPAALPAAGIAAALIGAVILLAGRKLFWLVLAAVGFFAGLSLAFRFLDNEAPWLVLLIGLVTGLVAAGLAVVLQKVAVSLAGFLLGGSAAVYFAEGAGLFPDAEWLPFVIGGVLAAFLAAVVFEWALIAVSAVAGALLVLQAVELEPVTALVGLVALSLIGVAVQSQGMLRRRSRAAS